MGKKILIGLGIIIVIISIWLRLSTNTSVINTSNHETFQTKVNGMVCSSCQVKVEQKIGAIKNVISVSANHITGDIIVIYEPSKKINTIKEIREGIDSLGYTLQNKNSKLEVLDYQFKNIGE